MVCYPGYRGYLPVCVRVTRTVLKNGLKYGYVKVDDAYYNITDLSGGLNAVSKVNLAPFELQVCGNASSAEDSIQTPPVGDRDHGDNCIVRVLIIYSDATLTTPGMVDITQLAHSSVNFMNTSLRNSGIHETHLTLDLVGIVKTNFVETSVIADDVDFLVNSGQVIFEVVAGSPTSRHLVQLRNDFQADVVVYFAGANLYGNADHGQAFDNEAVDEDHTANETVDNRAFAICNTKSLLAKRHVFAHEVGHLFGCDHVSTKNTECTNYDGAHRVKICLKKFHTLMDGDFDDLGLEHYSNPDISYKGKRTGDDCYRNNAKVLRTNACAVADFRETIYPLLVGIEGDRYGCPCGYVILEALTTGGSTGALSYQWQISDDGIIWSTVQSTSYNFIVDLPCVEGDGVFVQLTVTSTTAQSGTSVTFVEAADPVPGSSESCQRSIEENVSTKNGALECWPNPATDHFSVQWTNQEFGQVRIVLYDAQGKLLSVLANGDFSQGQHSLTQVYIPKGPGIYFIRGTINGRIQLKTIITL